MDEFQLFIHKYRELEQLSKEPNPYNLLKSSAILRSFFFDGSKSLADKIAKQLDFKVMFEVIKPEFGLVKIIPSTTYEYNTIVPGNNHLKTILLNRDEFYKMPIIYYSGNKYTVRQMILFGANVLGGVHLDLQSSRDPDYDALRKLKADIELKQDIIQEVTIKTMGILLPRIHVIQPIQHISEVVLKSFKITTEQ